ncbi:hypothetical protein SAMN06265338_10185 [Rhodoblastus acidophilus]|uniref:Selenocysteine lyase/Cysteine desulfurase n=1 Tax=Rhodoblastus acidophilus TaxID=1074 RepID=A0A212PX35_RHOAC|nr:hypothetical protein [Rhodoblastus acidophilus]PPQ37788.1 hypothetical protein CKO16_12395 [Rhodoblastus acidophilus]RAI17137.1 hypothetical protein CH337_17685 [Rhodoblastus acidophilus]SNB51475.1 hypothetical protein SAMN06265338_10185 [Rhodoblastus acidophilus]
MSQPNTSPSGRPATLAPLFKASAGDPLLAMMLASGGDERIAAGPDGRNRYGASARPEAGEIWFSSSTASGVSRRGWQAASAALPFAFSAGESEDWFSDLRRRLLNLLAPPGAQAVFCASGTQAEYAALALAGARARPGQKIVNILVGPEETGRGAPLAASGRHFLNSAPFGSGRAGFALDGWEGAAALAALPLRNGAGAPLPADEIDARVCALVRVARARGAHALVHLLDSSKTGLSAISRDCATKLLRDNPDDVTVVVDACQLRCAPAQVRADLDAGFLVMVSGSKFLGGPAFSGALLVPGGFAESLAARDQDIPWPEGLADHFAYFDWPPLLRDRIAGPFGARCNSGLGLRWTAALAELEAYCALDPALIEMAKACFQGEARRQILMTPGLEMDESGGEPTLIPIMMRGAEKGAADAALRKLRRRGLHLGQTVPIGGREALRLCLSAPQIVDFAWRYREIGDQNFAFGPLRADLEKLFTAWGALLG